MAVGLVGAKRGKIGFSHTLLCPSLVGHRSVDPAWTMAAVFAACPAEVAATAASMSVFICSASMAEGEDDCPRLQYR